MLLQKIATIRSAAAVAGHRAVILLEIPMVDALQDFVLTYDIPFVGATHTADRVDRITQVLGCEFETLVHETSESIDTGLLAALAGTIKAGGLLVLGLPFSLDNEETIQTLSPFNRRTAHLLVDMQRQFPDRTLWLPCADSRHALAADNRNELAYQLNQNVSPPSFSECDTDHLPTIEQAPQTAPCEQDKLLALAIGYLEHQAQGCITITGRRGRGKSALMGRIASWLSQQDISYAITAARQSALTSLHRHNTSPGQFIAADKAQHSHCRVLLVEEAGSLPIALLQSCLENHDHVIYCTTVEGYENAGRAFDIRFRQMLNAKHPHALWLEPLIPWRWKAGDPLESLIDNLLLNSTQCSGNDDSVSIANKTAPDNGCARLVNRSALADEEPLLRKIYGLLRDTHYQTSAADLAHLLDAPDLQLWILEDGDSIKAALLLVLEGAIDADLHEAIVSKQRRLPHQLLPQLLAQSANQPQGLKEVFGRVIRIAVSEQERRRGYGSRLLQAVERAVASPQGPVNGIGASFAGDQVSLAFWQDNGYSQFHTGFKANPRTGKQAVAFLKPYSRTLASVVERASAIHDDNQQWLTNCPSRSSESHWDEELLHRLAREQRSVHDTYAALHRLALTHTIPLDKADGVSRRQYEATLRGALLSILNQTQPFTS